MGVESATGAALGALESALRFREARQGVLSGNVANMDTPGYRRADIELDPGFDAALDRAADRVRTTHPGHVGGGGAVDPDYRPRREGPGTGPDRNGVDFDHEMLQLSRNAGAFTEAAVVHSRITALLRMAISGDGS